MNYFCLNFRHTFCLSAINLSFVFPTQKYFGELIHFKSITKSILSLLLCLLFEDILDKCR